MVGNLPMAVIAAIDSAILEQPEEVEEIFDVLLDDVAAEHAAHKVAQSLEVPHET